MGPVPDDGDGGPHVIRVPRPAPSSGPAPALLLRPWWPEDAAGLVAVYRDAALRRWTSGAVDDEAGARRWIEAQRHGWETGERCAFAVVEEPGASSSGRQPPVVGRVVGHVVLKGLDATGSFGRAEVGYWTAAHARGRGVASRALEALAGWAFTAFAGAGLQRLELLHQSDNTASCRVARKCRFDPVGVVSAAPPAFPLDGHLHARERYGGS
ncbi:GNAT family N-acetyltransferase [Streptomyces sp. AM6-12]|uniref:GNAT family N-acetyltransferase n=1 Tax=Streptomyces sp. AM6-12 TaxID=3345149 RepID=UPI0037AA7EA7